MGSVEEVTFRLARPDQDDGQAFCALMNSHYQRKTSFEYFLWQFFTGPHATRLCFAVTTSGEVVGSYGVQLRDVYPQSQPLAWSVDIIVHPSYRGRGLLGRMAQFARQQTGDCRPFGCVVLANQAGAAAHVQGLNWQEIQVYRDYAAATTAARPFASSGLSFERMNQSFDVEALGCPARRFSKRRTWQYLSWRFGRHPKYKYDQFVALDGPQVWGYVALKEFQDPRTGERFGDIVDLAWNDNEPNRLRAMLDFALQQFRADKVPAVCMWLQSDTALDAIACDVGFRETSRTRTLCGMAASEADQAIFRDPGSWQITMADAEIY